MKQFLTVITLLIMVLVGVTSVVNATIIETIGGSWAQPFGEGETFTATMGQTFRLNDGDDTVLDSVTFYIDDWVNPDTIDFAFYLYPWDGAKITGYSLFTSGKINTNGGSGFEPYTVNTGGVNLRVGADYVWFISASNFFDGLIGTGMMSVNDWGTYEDGNFVYMNNENDFGQLSTTSWSQWKYTDSQFRMELSQVPEPGTILLLGSGLVGLIGFRRKFMER